MKSTTHVQNGASPSELPWHFRSPYPPEVQRELGGLCLRLAAMETRLGGREEKTLLQLAERFGTTARLVSVFGLSEAIAAALYRLIYIRTRDPLLERFAESMATIKQQASLRRPGRVATEVGWLQFRRGLQAMGATRREFFRAVSKACRPRTVDPCFISGTFPEGAQ